MKTHLLILLMFFIIPPVIISACAKNEMHEPKEKTPGGQAVLDKQIEPTDRGKEAIQLTDDNVFPGSEPFEDAKYEFIAEETPAKVAHWFEVNLEGCRVEKISRENSSDDSWIVTKNDLIIEIHRGPGEENTLIKYKVDLKYKNTPNPAER